MLTTAGESTAIWSFAEHEHRELVRGINRLHDVACDIGHRPALELAVDLLNLLGWLDSTFGPHVAWEETWLYPEIDARLGTPWATQAARFDHRQIRVMAARLRNDHDKLVNHDPGDPQVETRCHLFGLEALLRAHIEREERFLIPLLDNDRP